MRGRSTGRPRDPSPPDPSDSQARPKTAPMKRRSKLRSSLKYQMMGSTKFGRDAPKFTIGSSRREYVPPIPLPGPGAYDPENVKDYRKIKPVFPKSRPSNVNVSPTANVEFADCRQFPGLREAHIGVRGDLVYADPIESPGPNYVPQPERTMAHRISSRLSTREVERSAHLGPGCYDVKFANQRREPAFFFAGPKKRDDWMVDKQGTPGPGAYNTDCREMLKREPKWTIGRKSRLRRRMRNTEVVTRPKDMIAVDQCIVDLSPLPNPEDARKYVMTHPDLREIVHELLEIVFMMKPEDPVDFIRSCLESWKNGDTMDNISIHAGSSQNSQREE